MCRTMADAAVGRWLSAVSFWEGQAVRRIFQRWRRLNLLKLATAEQHRHCASLATSFRSAGALLSALSCVPRCWPCDKGAASQPLVQFSGT